MRSVSVQPRSSTRIHHFLVSSSSSLRIKGVPPSSGLRPLLAQCQRQWRLHAWLLLALAMLFLIKRADASGPRSKSDAASDAMGSAASASLSTSTTVHPGEQLYIVLVSIPVLDRVLPLKNLAEELLSRGYRIGFALPEVRLQNAHN